MKSIRFLGASSGNVTGSSYQLNPSRGKPILIDLGMFQGSDEVSRLNYEEYKANVRSLEGAILTHAHLDHCGRLPILLKMGFTGKIYMTEPTRKLAEVVLYDSAKIASKDRDKTPLYSHDDVTQLLEMARVVKYGEQFELGEFNIVMRDAGHILGSASLEIAERSTKKIAVFSGDLGNSPQDIERPTEMIEKGDYVVMESTYGDRAHPKENAKEILKEEINEVEKTGGVLLVPAFSIERTQVLLHFIDHLKKERQVRNSTPVYLDSPMAITATEIYGDFRELYGEELAEHARSNDPFDFPGLNITEDSSQSKKIQKMGGAKVIIAGSGMMSGGRIVTHARDYLPRPSTRLLIVGYQAVETLGREIIEGAKSVNIYGEDVRIKANIREIHSMSAHADQPRLMAWLKNIKGVKKVFLTHGEDMQREALGQRIKTETGIKNVSLPEINEEIGL